MRKMLIAAVLTLVSAHAHADIVYSNTGNGTSACCLGSGGGYAIGEEFNLSQPGQLVNWSFFGAPNTSTTFPFSSGDLELAVAAYASNESNQIIYTSQAQLYSGGATPITFSKINLWLQAGSYIAYLVPAAGSNPPVKNAALMLSDGRGGIGNGYGNTDSFAVPILWSTSQTENLQFEATVAPVPLPAAAWLLLSGLGGLGFFARKREPT